MLVKRIPKLSTTLFIEATKHPCIVILLEATFTFYVCIISAIKGNLMLITLCPLQLVFVQCEDVFTDKLLKHIKSNSQCEFAW